MYSDSTVSLRDAARENDVLEKLFEVAHHLQKQKTTVIFCEEMGRLIEPGTEHSQTKYDCETTSDLKKKKRQ